MATVSDVQGIVLTVEEAGNAVLAVVEGLDPALALPTAAITALEGLANAALAGWAAASGSTVVTVAELQALELNPLPGPEPTE